MKKVTIILLSIGILGTLFSVYAWFAKRETNRCFSFNFANQLAEAAAERDGMLPEGFDAFAAWHNRKEPRSPWSANGLASLYDVLWGISVTNLTQEFVLEQPTIISCKPEYLKETEKEINRAFVRSFLGMYRNRTAKVQEDTSRNRADPQH